MRTVLACSVLALTACSTTSEPADFGLTLGDCPDVGVGQAAPISAEVTEAVDTCVFEVVDGDAAVTSPGDSETLLIGTGAGEVTVAYTCTAGDASDSTECTLTVLDCAALAGTWLLDVTDVTSSCGPEDGWTSTLAIDQAGCGTGQISVGGIKGDATKVTADVDGDAITVSGDFAEAGGTTSLTLSLTALAWDRAAGTESWTWTDGGTTCSNGTASVTLMRQ